MRQDRILSRIETDRDDDADSTNSVEVAVAPNTEASYGAALLAAASFVSSKQEVAA